LAPEEMHILHSSSSMVFCTVEVRLLRKSLIFFFLLLSASSFFWSLLSYLTPPSLLFSSF